MRKSFVASIAIVTAIAIATPAAAAPSQRDRSEPPAIVKFVKNLAKRIFRVQVTHLPIGPIPLTTPDPDPTETP